jgi:8-oxo-dGTP pyrophosphatase MutT (NUDIX family)
MARKAFKQKEIAKAALRQVGALPMREREGRLEVCLVTTRTTGRWTVPKGWPMKGQKDHVAARIEAEQEAGVTGKARKKPVGNFLYWKRREAHFDLVNVDVYPLKVTHTLPTWKERDQRKVCWVEPGDASIVVEEPGLAALLLSLHGSRQDESGNASSTVESSARSSRDPSRQR